MKSTILLLVALAVATGAYGSSKQIMIAPPPPPAAQSGIGPGLIFGFVVPGYTNSTFGSTQINQLCAALVNFTVGYPRTALKCYLGPEGVNPYSGNAVVVTGFLQWQNFPGMTDQDKANAFISRDANEYFLQNNAVGGLNTTFPGIAVDCSCNPFYNPTGFFGPETRPIAGVPYASCTTEPKSSDADDTENKVGLNNGKVCPTGPQYIVPANFETTANLGGTGAYLSCNRDGETFRCQMEVDQNNVVLQNIAVDQRFRLFLNNVQIITGDCTQEQSELNLDILNSPSGDEEGPGTFYVTSVDQRNVLNQKYFAFNAPLVCSGDSFWMSANYDGGDMRVRGQWNPLCDSDFAFYKANNPIQEDPVASMPSIGYTCPACASSSGNAAVLFNYNGPNKGKYCSTFPITGGVFGAATSAYTSTMTGTSCIKIGVNTGSLATTGGKPSLTTANDDLPVSVIFPGLDVLPFLDDVSYVAIDTQMNVPCSTPPLLKAPTPGAVAGLISRGTCNTVSLFNNGGTGPKPNGNGIPEDVDSCAILTTVINGPLAPGASPPNEPSPAVSPKPIVPSPAVGPSPSPILPPLKCTYAGVYRIRPYYAPCGGKYIAWASPSNCSNTVVNLRSAADLGGKLQRAAWALKTSATGKVGVPTPIVAPKECAAKHLAAPSNPSNGLKLGGDSWKWQVVPAEGTKTCDMVNLISENRLQTTAFLSVPKINNKQCSGKFAWAAKDGGRQRFRITKV